MKVDTTTIRLIVAMVEEGSISRAANRLGLAVAAASRRVTDLETQLDARLFRRVAHGVELTETGHKLVGYLQQIDNLVDRLAGDARTLVGGLNGRIIIGAPKAVVIEFLAADIAAIQRAYPGISLKIVEENSKIVQQMLRDRVIDIGIYERTSGFLALPPIRYREDRLVLVYHRSHFAFAVTPVPLDALFDVPIVSLGKGSAVLTAVQRAFRSSGRRFDNDYSVTGFDSMLAVVRHGLGVGLMPSSVLRSFHPEPDIVTAELEGDWPQRSYVLSFVEGHAQAQTLANIVQALVGAPPA
ncbi:MAG: LysR family transcriptional regulator [Burkholderia sp.]